MVTLNGSGRRRDVDGVVLVVEILRLRLRALGDVGATDLDMSPAVEGAAVVVGEK